MHSDTTSTVPDYAQHSVAWFRRMLMVVGVVMAMLLFARLTRSESIPFDLTYEAQEGMKSVGWWLIGLAVLFSLVAAVKGLKAWRHDQGLGKVFWLSLLSVPGIPIGILLWAAALFGAPSFGHGRPLRLRGRSITPRLRMGSDWSRGPAPSCDRLDRATRDALEALWLDDARSEHASVPAFARMSWILAAFGAPAELLEGSHRAALQEIKHTRSCFALASGYGGRTHSVEAMPELLRLGIDAGPQAWAQLAIENITDGCLTETFNARVAAYGAARCTDKAARQVLDVIAHEEAEHAELAWSVVAWMVSEDRRTTTTALELARAQVERASQPPATSLQSAALVAKADVPQLLAHGRLSDAERRTLWQQSLRDTHRRLAHLLATLAADGRAAA